MFWVEQTALGTRAQRMLAAADLMENPLARRLHQLEALTAKQMVGRREISHLMNASAVNKQAVKDFKSVADADRGPLIRAFRASLRLNTL